MLKEETKKASSVEIRKLKTVWKEDLTTSVGVALVAMIGAVMVTINDIWIIAILLYIHFLYSEINPYVMS